jgi:hypothetical protein
MPGRNQCQLPVLPRKDHGRPLSLSNGNVAAKVYADQSCHVFQMSQTSVGDFGS